MSKYTIVNHLPKIGDVFLQSGMILRYHDAEVPTDVEGPCDVIGGKLYIWPSGWKRALSLDVGDEVEVVSEQRNEQLLIDRKNAVVYANSSWQERIGEENTKQFDPSNEGW